MPITTPGSTSVGHAGPSSTDMRVEGRDLVGLPQKRGSAPIPQNDRFRLVRFRPKAVEPVRTRLRVSPLLLAQIGALRFAAFLLLTSSPTVDAKQGRRTKKTSLAKTGKRRSRSREEDDKNRETKSIDSNQ
ncbi:hypothetical protein Scep_014601 [Stephania cephalantha]|uniref:Uncharacterized protein n=1 Tax=Stephania cephalantha TaxID=152367 RepID=A0AAP0P1W5_9MAGN